MSPLYLTAPDYRRSEITGWTGTASPTVYSNYDEAFSYSNGATIPASGVMGSYGIWLPAGAVITSLVFRSGTVAAGTPTNWWFALYDTAATPNLLQQTADQTSTAWAANTTKDIALAAPVTTTVAGVYFAALMVKASVQPNMQGVNNAATITTTGTVAGQPAKAQSSGSALTTTAPATITSPTTTGIMIPYVEAH